MGQFSEYREYVKEREESERQSQRAIAQPKVQQQRAHDNTKRKLSFKEQRELEQLERDLASLAEERATLEAELNAGTANYSRLSEISSRIEQIISIVDDKEMRWLELNE